MADSLFHDIRYAVRILRRQPLFAATVAVTLGLGLGLVGSAFTIVNAYLLKPIDLPNPDALVSLRFDTERTRQQRMRRSDYEALETEVRPFAVVAAAQDVRVMRDAVTTSGLLVTGNYFEMLGARPARGRLLRPDDAAVVVLSHEAWRSRYGSDPAIVGQRIPLGRQRFEVVGITEPFAYLSGQEGVSFWAPLTMASAFPGIDRSSEADAPSLVVVGRLRQDVTSASLRAWFDVWLHRRFPATSDTAPIAVRVDSLATHIPLNDQALTMVVLIMSAFGLVLLVASANVTNLMLARALARQPEIAVRLALGASRWRVVRQLTVESLVLAVPGAVAGLALIVVTARVFPAAILSTFPPGVLPIENVLIPLDPDMRVMVFLAAAAVLSAMLITLAPAGRLARLRLAQATRGEVSPDARGSRLRSSLVAMQIGACVLFLVGAFGLIDQSSRLANPQFNLSFERVSIVRVDPDVRASVARRLASDAAVERVAAASRPPLMGSPSTVRATASTTRIALNTGYTIASPEFFAIFDIQIVRGRTFTPTEAAAGEAVALVSTGMAAALWPGADPLGQTFALGAVAARTEDRRLPRGRVRVVGVTEDVANGTILDGIDASWVYFPTDVQALPELSMIVRARTGDIGALRAAVATAVNEVAPDSPVQVDSMPMLLGTAVWVFQAFSVTASLLGIVGLLFAYSGTHAVVSFLVAQRTREFGVRMALGASSARLVWGMLIETSRTASIGLAAGLAIAAALVRVFAGSIPIVPNVGPRPFVVGAAIVIVATGVSALSALRAAARIDPVEALRSE